jgi:Ala-tRNA(Pro) deacylase
MSKVTEHLEASGVDYEVLPHDPAVTARAEARALGIDAHDVVKTVVLDIRTGHAFAVIPADRHLDLTQVRAALNSKSVSLASEDEIARDYPEFELGAIPPLGPLARTPLIVDPEVLDNEYVVFAGGTQSESVRIHTSDLLAHAAAKIAPICTD